MSGAIYVCTSSNFHPYECDGPGRCIHCDGARSEHHDPDRCWLCHNGPPPGLCKCGGSGVIDSGRPSDVDADANVMVPCPECSADGRKGEP